MRGARSSAWRCVRLASLPLVLAFAALCIAGAPLSAQVATAKPEQPSDSAALALVERTSAAYQSARTLRAEFVQTLSNPRTGNSMRSVGEFLQRGTQQFAFRFSDPPEDRIVADGEVLWLYLPSSAKGQVLKLPRQLGAGLDLAASVLKDPRERYRVEPVSDTTIAGRAVRAVKLTPRTSDAQFRQAVLWIDTQDALIRRAEITEVSGLKRTLEFTRVRMGVELPADAFVFVPPEGVRVIGDRVP